MSDRKDIDAIADKAELKEEISRTYEWNGKPLLPFSVGRHTALQRLHVAQGSQMEAAAALVRLCQLPPEEVVRIRGEECSKFLVELEAWMNAEGIGLGSVKKAQTAKLVTLYNTILDDLYEADRVTPQATGVTPGKA